MTLLVDSPVIVFDLDGTLTDRDTYLHFLVQNLARLPRRWLNAHKLSYAVAGYLTGQHDNSWLKETYLSLILGGLATSELPISPVAYADTVTDRWIRKHGVARLRKHKDDGHVVVLASASLDIYVRPIAERLGISCTIATRVAVAPDGRLTGRLAGANCQGIEKRNRVIAFCKSLGVDGPDCVYSDSDADIPLLESCAKPVCVNPTRRLRTVALARRWMVEHWT